MASIVIALGASAILKKDELGTFAQQSKNVEETCRHIARLTQQGHKIVLACENDLHLESILQQNEEAYKAASVPPVPLDACLAEAHGLLGYMIQGSLRNEMQKLGVTRPVVPILTHALVREDDPAFANPARAVGACQTKTRAEKLSEQRGYTMKEDLTNRGFRRVVAAPEPQAVVEAPVIQGLLESGAVVIVTGGGIPVIEIACGQYQSIEAVMDKDLTAQRLATGIGAEYLFILTDVEYVATNFSRPGEAPIHKATVKQMSDWHREGHFRQPTMGPKVTAAMRFVSDGGKEAVITSLSRVGAALDGAGTHIAP